MNYNSNLKDKLIEWRNRLLDSTSITFDSNFNFFLKKLGESPPIKSIMDQALNLHPLTENEKSGIINDIQRRSFFKYESESQRAALLYQIITYLLSNKWTPLNLISTFGDGHTYNEGIPSYVNSYIDPIVHYIIDQMEDVSFILYLLEKFKFRAEWFKKKALAHKYRTAESNYEQIFEDHLRLYLFDQGVDYPFSTPKSATGRADIVSLIDTNDPLILEIKIYDKEKSYGKQRIIEGFNQIVKYSNDYNKNTGYLVVFNMNNVEIQIQSVSQSPTVYNMIEFNSKIYYIITINLNDDFTASQAGQLKAESIMLNELISHAGKLIET